MSEQVGDDARLGNGQTQGRIKGGPLHLGVRVQQRFAYQLGTLAPQIAEATRRLDPHLGRRIVEEDLERPCRHIGLLDGHHPPKRRAGDSPRRGAFAGGQGQLAYLGGVDKPGVERQGDRAQARRRVRHHSLFQHGAQIVRDGVGAAEEGQRRHARLFRCILVRRNLRQNRGGLGRGAHGDLVE